MSITRTGKGNLPPSLKLNCKCTFCKSVVAVKAPARPAGQRSHVKKAATHCNLAMHATYVGPRRGDDKNDHILIACCTNCVDLTGNTCPPRITVFRSLGIEENNIGIFASRRQHERTHVASARRRERRTTRHSMTIRSSHYDNIAYHDGSIITIWQHIATTVSM